jgi:hypothetical protein
MFIMPTRRRNRVAPKATKSKVSAASRKLKSRKVKDASTRSREAAEGKTKVAKGRVRTDIRRAKQTKDAQVEEALAETYDRWKNFEGKRYKGMKVGSHHKWYYDQGVWRERKMTPDEWTFDFAVKKRRAGKAPEGSGVPVGTEYHWFIIAHQHVKKLNANIYSTALAGTKFKAGYRRADKPKWDVSENAQKKRIIRFLKKMLAELEDQVE